MNQLIKLSIITTFKFGCESDLQKTVLSVRSQLVRPFEHILILSGVNDEAKLKSTYLNSYTKIIINQDRSLYNAMNIGLDYAGGDCVIFLNGGDYFLNHKSIELIQSYHRNGQILIFRTLQRIEKIGFIRPRLDKMKMLKNYPSHQSFIAPLSTAKSVRFQERSKIEADVIWMKSLMKLCVVNINPNILSVFELGGVSNNPNMKSVITYLTEYRIRQAILEFSKWIIYISLFKSRIAYYSFIYMKKYNTVILKELIYS